MRALALALAVAAPAAPVAGCAASDRTAYFASLGAVACDWNQTRGAAGDSWYYGPRHEAYPSVGAPGWRARGMESNPILGRHPTQEKVDTYFATAVLIHTAIYFALPRGYRTAYAGLVGVAEVGQSLKNLDTNGMCHHE